MPAADLTGTYVLQVRLLRILFTSHELQFSPDFAVINNVAQE